MTRRKSRQSTYESRDESEERVSDGLSESIDEVKRLEEDGESFGPKLPIRDLAAARGYQEASGKTATIMSVWPGRLILTGPSGAKYLWESAGAKVEVALEDVDSIMGRNRSKSRTCCGNSAGRTYFVKD